MVGRQFQHHTVLVQRVVNRADLALRVGIGQGVVYAAHGHAQAGGGVPVYHQRSLQAPVFVVVVDVFEFFELGQVFSTKTGCEILVYYWLIGLRNRLDLNLELGGFAGQMSFGHVAFFGVGAYVSSVMQMRYGFSPWWGLPGAALAGALVAGFVALVSFRAGLKGSYFALITLAFGEVLRIISNSVDITGGGLGMLIPMKAGVANFQFEERSGFYFLILLFAAASVALAEWLRRSRFGSPDVSPVPSLAEENAPSWA